MSGEEEWIPSRSQNRVKKRELEPAELSIGTICTSHKLGTLAGAGHFTEGGGSRGNTSTGPLLKICSSSWPELELWRGFAIVWANTEELPMSSGITQVQWKCVHCHQSATLPWHASTHNGYILDLSLEFFWRISAKMANTWWAWDIASLKKDILVSLAIFFCRSYIGVWSWILVPGCPDPDTNSPNVTVNITRDMTPTQPRHQDTHLIFKPRKTNHHNDILPSRTHTQTNWTTQWKSFLLHINIFFITTLCMFNSYNKIENETFNLFSFDKNITLDD